MRTKLAAAAFVLAAITAMSSAMSSAEAAYRLCVRAGGFDGRQFPVVFLSIGGVIFEAKNGGYYNTGYGPMDPCFDGATAFGRAMTGCSTPRFDCVGTMIAEGQTTEVWFEVDSRKIDPGLGGLVAGCKRIQ